ncbi:YolD-like family protein [Brevibacillus sp. SYSU BS000544]|uniref:YolD-like family protein n=1 Tax=Brevibacillus sp. SYSU BS000544 TaxID=3416443 RepID=UPI003CE5637E
MVYQQELSSIDYLIRDSARNDYSVEITWWEQYKESRGKNNSFCGVIKWIEQQARRIKLENDKKDIQWIQMDKIVDVMAK